LFSLVVVVNYSFFHDLWDQYQPTGYTSGLQSKTATAVTATATEASNTDMDILHSFWIPLSASAIDTPRTLTILGAMLLSLVYVAMTPELDDTMTNVKM
jgi:hypothetical protein